MNNVNMIIEKDAIIKHSNLFLMGKKALIVTGKSSAKKSGALDDVLSALEKENIECRIYDCIEQNPSVESCRQAGEFGKDCDFVIGIGGGSPLDACKAIAVFAANPTLNEEDFYAKKWEKKPLNIILVGTTAGTGSEVTKVSVLTDSKGKKHSIHDPLLYAKTVFGDPKYTLSLNKEFTISTGIDAICHAGESWFSNKANEESRNHSIKAIELIYKNLLYLKEKDELTYLQRENLYRGSIEAGYAIDITGTTFGHNVGYYFTEEYHLPHGIASAIFLEDVLLWQLEHNRDYALSFLDALNMSKDKFLKLIDLLPEHNITMTVKEIETILPRWENNNSVKNTYGTMTIGDIKEILIRHFVK